MSWLTPWTGFIVASVAVPLLLLLYFLKLRRTTLTVSSTLLWVRSTEDIHANAPFQRLRRNLLLLLQLIALLLLVLALMQPRLEGVGSGGGRTVLLIDRSGSMAATDDDEGRTRLERAVIAAGDEVDRLHAGGLFASSDNETMIITFADRAEIVQPFTDSRQQLQSALANITITHGRSQLEDALNLSRVYSTNTDVEDSDRRAEDPAALVLYSDGRLQDLEGLVLRGESLSFERIGTDAVDNVAVAHIAAERPFDRPAAIEVFAALENHGINAVDTDVQLSVNGLPRRVEEVTIPGATIDAGTGVHQAGRRTLVFTPFEQERNAVIEVEVLREDDLDADDAGQLVVPPPRRLRVGLVSPGRRLVRRILEGLALERLEVMTPDAYEAALADRGPGAWDVLVFDAVAPASMPPVPSLFLGRVPPSESLQAYGTGEGQVVLNSMDEHPLLRYVDLDSLYIDRAVLVQGTQGGQVLVEGSKGPLVSQFSDEGIEHIFVGFDPIADTNWPYQHGLGVFLFNGVEFLGHHGDATTRGRREAGEMLVAHLPADAKKIELTTPDGDVYALAVADPRRTTWGPIERSGIHAISWQSPLEPEPQTLFESVRFPVEVESEANVAPSIMLGRETFTSSGGAASRYVPLWPWAIGMCLVILMIEWWIWTRRVGTT
jgi:hypothetical protein